MPSANATFVPVGFPWTPAPRGVSKSIMMGTMGVWFEDCDEPCSGVVCDSCQLRHRYRVVVVNRFELGLPLP